MPVTFVNNWKNILDKLRNILRAEFGNTVRVYIGDEDTSAGNQFIRLNPVRSELVKYDISAETREFTIEMIYVFSGAGIKKTSLDHIFRIVSRTEALIHDNISMTLADNTSAYDCRLVDTEFNSDAEDVYVVEWEWKCLHMGNQS